MAPGCVVAHSRPSDIQYLQWVRQTPGATSSTEHRWKQKSSSRRCIKIGVAITCYSCCSHLCNMCRNTPQYQKRDCNHQQASNWKIIWISMLSNNQVRQWGSMFQLNLPATMYNHMVHQRVRLGGNNRTNQTGSLMINPRLSHMHQLNLLIPSIAHLTISWFQCLPRCCIPLPCFGT